MDGEEGGKKERRMKEIMIAVTGLHAYTLPHPIIRCLFHGLKSLVALIRIKREKGKGERERDKCETVTRQ